MLTTSRRQRRALIADNRRHDASLRLIAKENWPEAVLMHHNRPISVWRSRDFLAMLFEHERTARLSICRTMITGDDWADNISWDDMQRLKRECGFGDRCAIELFPPDAQVVNVANMRHLWLVPSPSFMWGAVVPAPLATEG